MGAAQGRASIGAARMDAPRNRRNAGTVRRHPAAGRLTTARCGPTIGSARQGQICGKPAWRDRFQRSRGAAASCRRTLDSRSVGSVMHPCAQRLWMPVPCSQTKPRQKICSVNFRPFSAYKERSEFENSSVSKKSFHSLYARHCHPALRSKSAGLQDSRSVGSVMHPCAQRLWMPVPCSQTKPAKICSVNFRPFSAYKERSEFETVPCPPKSLHSFYARPRHPKPSATRVPAFWSRVPSVP